MKIHAKNFVAPTEKHAGRNGNPAINFAWPNRTVKYSNRTVTMLSKLELIHQS